MELPMGRILVRLKVGKRQVTDFPLGVAFLPETDCDLVTVKVSKGDYASAKPFLVR